ncbi:MAG TPA: haloacid dehalogenase type II [Hyphomicrobiales bacterium]|nr:haloacid dehalogenase type II [Hyphomicrobiales bacterium]
MALSAIKAVLFDAYGTLFDVHSPAARIAGDIGENTAAISDLWRTKQLQYTWLRSLMQAHAPFDKVTEDALDYALAQYSVASPEIRSRLLQLYLTLDAYPDAPDALKRLKSAGIVTGILSNGSPSMLSSAVNSAKLGATLDHVLSIESVGVYKPDPRVYRFGAETVGYAPGEVGFVSANGWDAAGAAHFGFQVIHLNRFDQPREMLPSGPAVVLKSLNDAAAAILD